MLVRDGQELLYVPFNNWGGGNLDFAREMLTHPHTVPGLGDAGAHCGLLSDGNFPTFLVTHWGRDRPTDRLPLEWLVMRQTKDTAEVVGLHDRGVLAPGYKADINVIDFAALALTPPTLAFDLPAGGRRLVQKAKGYSPDHRQRRGRPCRRRAHRRATRSAGARRQGTPGSAVR